MLNCNHYNYFEHGFDALLSVKCEKEHWDLLKLIGHLCEMFRLVAQRRSCELLQHHFRQSHVADLETAPQCVHILHAQIERIFADERRFARSCWPCEDRQLSTSVAFQ